jgi:hypothetical protein
MARWSGNRLTLLTESDGQKESKTGIYANGSFTMTHDEDGKKMTMTFRRK